MSKKNKQQNGIAAPDVGSDPIMSSEIATRSAAELVGYLDYLPNPDRILIELGGNVAVYRDMLDAHMDSVRVKRYAAITARPWSIANDAGDTKKIKWVQEYLWRLGLRGTVCQMLKAIDYGFAVHEIIWAVVPSPFGQLILPAKIKERKQEWFLFDDESNLLLKRKEGTHELMPPRKFLTTRRQPSDVNPYGENVLSRCFWPLVFKKGGLKFWMLCVEKYGMPKAVAKLPGSATESEKSKMLEMLRLLVRDAVAVIPANGSVELLESMKAGAGQSDPHYSIIRWADSEMSKAWLGETLTTEQTSAGGTQAMATVHNDVRADLALDDAAMIEESVNELLKWIWEINFPDDEQGIPWFDITMPEDLKQARIDRDGKLAQTLGVRFNSDYIADVYEISKKYFTVVDPQQPQGGAFAEGDRHDRHDGCFAEGDLKANVTQMLADLKPKALQDQIEELAKPIIDLAESCGSYSDFEAALSKAVPDLSSKSLEQSVTKCLLLSEMQGRADA